MAFNTSLNACWRPKPKLLMTLSETHRPLTKLLYVLFAAIVPCPSRAQTVHVTIPPSTPLAVELRRHVPMKAGEQIEGRLLYPIYAANHVGIPADSLLRGTVVRLDSDHHRRVHSRLRGDFTPFHIPVIRFDEVVMPDGSIQPIVALNAADGAPILRLAAPAAKSKSSFISREVALAKQRFKEQAAVFTAPGRTDRLVQFVYQQLPYHPERIESGTSWTVELAQPLELEQKATPASYSTKAKDLPPDPVTQRRSDQPAKEKSDAAPLPSADPSPDQERAWRLRAYLKQTISSANSQSGDPFQAVVAEPVFNADHSIAVPQGALLIGKITQAKRARSFGRNGKLRFNFRELKLPDGFSQQVEGILTAANSNKSEDLQMDSEGAIQPKAKNRVIVPLVLTLLAGRAFDGDGSQIGNNTVAANGFGVVGRVVGIVASSRNVAAGIGFYGAALAFYDRWLARGHDVIFVKDTRIEVTTTPNRSTVIEPNLK